VRNPLDVSSPRPALRLAMSLAMASWPTYSSGPVVEGKAVAVLPVEMPEVGSLYASRKMVQSRRSGNEVRRTFPGSERTGCWLKMSEPVSESPLTRWKEYDHQAP
jgi:hypothetical protein